MQFSITNTTRKSIPSSNFIDIKNAVLGKDYFLSLVFINQTKSRKINFTYRKKDKSTNVLSFPLDKKCGEIFICPEIAKKEGLSVGFLFIHGLLHLKGMEHGSTMERAEEKLCKKFGI